MLIEHILATKGNTVVSVRCTDTVSAAVEVLRVNRIGAVVVSDDGGTVDGILSERDVVRVLATEGPAALGHTVTSAMTRTVHTCEPGTTVDELMALMTEQRIRHVPVVHEQRLVGVVSIGDVVKHRLDELGAEAQALHDYVTSGR